MKLYLTVSRVGKYDFGVPRPTLLVKEVPWVCPPPKDETIFVGKSEDGSHAGINARVARVSWCSDGEINIDANLLQLGDEYDAILALLVRDGFR